MDTIPPHTLPPSSQIHLFYMRRDAGFYVSTWPTRTGSDVVGEMVSVGSQVQGFKEGDRVLASATYLMSEKLEVAAVEIPSGLEYEDVVVLGLVTSTAASDTYPAECLGLELPSVTPKSNGKKLLVVGLGRPLGGTLKVFGYKSPSMVGDLVAELGKDCVGAYDGGFFAICGSFAVWETNDADGMIAIGSQVAMVLASLGGGKVTTV